MITVEGDLYDEMWAIEHKDDDANFYSAMPTIEWNGTINGALLFYDKNTADKFATTVGGTVRRVLYERPA